MRVSVRSTGLAVLSLVTGGLLFAAPPPPPGPTAPPSPCQKVMYHANLDAVGTIRPAGAGAAPIGSCSQITLTAWRNDYDYNCTLARTPHESTTATGPDISNCSYTLPVEMGHMVVIKATSAIPMWKVTLSYNNSSETSASIWEEKHPVTINWRLQRTVILPKQKAN